MCSSVDISAFGDARLGGVVRADEALPLVVNIVRAALPPRQHSSHVAACLVCVQQGCGIGGTVHVCTVLVLITVTRDNIASRRWS